MTSKTKTIQVDYLARVEGEGALYVRIKDDKVEEVELKIFEPPRFFEAFMQGRSFQEAPDITARICGICPVAYQMSACHAMEDALGIKIDPAIRELRRLLYCGEWIESHVLHMCMLHAPDFLGFEDAISMAEKFPEAVERGLQLKKAGNEIVRLLGGREIHPVNVKVGGFYRIPSKNELQQLEEKLNWAKDAAEDILRWVATFDYPDFEQDYEFVALRHPEEYPFCEGEIVSNRGLKIDNCDFEQHFQEQHVEHTNALHCVHIGHGPYMVGPLARFNLNFDKLPIEIQNLSIELGFKPECRNPFKSLMARGVEVLYSCHEALRVINEYQSPEHPSAEFKTKTAVGYGCTEAPRGMLYHRYELDDQGIIKTAQIIPPTSQNQKRIEKDLYHFAQQNIHEPEQKLTWQCEQAVRNYDPCISCATHFLKLEMVRE